MQEADKSSDPLPRWPFVLVGPCRGDPRRVVLYSIFRPRADVWTDDAYVMVNYATSAPRISGRATAVSVDDNDTVRAGEVLAMLDPRDNQTAVASAEAALARDTAQLGEVSASVARQPSIIEEQQSAVSSAQAKLAAQANARRYDNLALTGAGRRKSISSGRRRAAAGPGVRWMARRPRLMRRLSSWTCSRRRDPRRRQPSGWIERN